MQETGQPPAELIKELAPGLQFTEDGMPMMPNMVSIKGYGSRGVHTSATMPPPRACRGICRRAHNFRVLPVAPTVDWRAGRGRADYWR